MPSSSKAPGTVSNIDASYPWSNIDNVKVFDYNYATGTSSGGKDNGSGIICTNFGFDIPSGATINGILAYITKYESSEGADIKDSTIKLRTASGVVGSNMASAVEWPTWFDWSPTYGGVADMWGTSLTRDDVVSSDFGIHIRVTVPSGTAYIDAVVLVIYYTEGGSAKPYYYFRNQ